VNPTYFTVIGDFKAIVADTELDSDHDPDLAPITAKILFTPMLATGDVILATHAQPRPTGFVPVPIQGVIDTDGRVKLRRRADDGASEFTPVRLLADTELLELKTPLFYRVTFTEVKFNGKPGIIAPFVFQAPNADVQLNLITVMRQPGQPASGIVKIAPGRVRLLNDGRLQFSFAGVDIPDPVELDIGGGVSSWDDLEDKPKVIAAGDTAQDAADVIHAVRAPFPGMQIWTGTEAEYLAIPVKNPNTLYAVT
jgi:hypothetical protein